MPWRVVFHPSAEKELDVLRVADRVAVLHATEKLAALGPGLPHPHQSDVRGGSSVRELRPRAGRSRVRPLYGRIGDVFVVVAIAPEAMVDRRVRPVRTGCRGTTGGDRRMRRHR